MRIDVITAPYDSGHRAVRMGQGPQHLIGQGLPDRLREVGHDVYVTIAEDGSRFPTETSTSFSVYRDVARHVAESRRIRALPLVLGGNCGNAVGTAAGCGAKNLAVVWLDAHGDYMTPENTRTGFLDGMAISVMTGRAWRGMAASIPGFSPIDPARILHVGARDWDPGEQERFIGDGGSVLSPDAVKTAELHAAIERTVANADQILLHIDFDVLDPGVAVANPFPAPGGLAVSEIVSVARAAAAARPVAAIVFASYDPAAGGAAATTAAMDVVVEAVSAAASLVS